MINIKLTKRYKFFNNFSRPFSILSDQTSLEIGDSMQVTIKFKPINVGDYKKDLTVEFDCGKPSV